jgi:hypothetical protein
VLRTATFAVAWGVAPTRDYNDGFLPNPDSDQIGVWLVATAVIGVSAAVDIIKVGGAVRRPEGRGLNVLPLLEPASQRVGFTIHAMW